MKMTDDYIRWVEPTQTEIMNDDKSDSIKHDNIYNTGTASSTKNQSNGGTDEYAKDAIENKYCELIQARNIKYIEHAMKCTRHIIDQNSAKPKDYDKWTDKEQYEYILNNLKIYIPSIPDSLSFFVPALLHLGDCGRNSTDKPLWLDMEKFQRGQKFMRDHIFSIFLANTMSLFAIFAFPDGLKTLIFSRQSHTPYLAFKRYLSTSCRIRNWMTGNPWTVGTRAYNDIQTVRKMHRAVLLKLYEHDDEEIDRITKIQNPWCPDRETILEDFSSLTIENDYLHLLSVKGINQAEMASTQFAFMGLILLYSHELGIYASDEDIAAFCHTWRGIGYLLGIEDQYNFCRGSLKEIKQRSRDFVEFWVKFYLQQVTPEWEHMLRCVTESMSYLEKYYFNFKVLLLFVTNLLNIDMPRTRNTLTYFEWFNLMFLCFIFRYAIKLQFVREFLNKRVHKTLDKGLKYRKPYSRKDVKRF